MCFLACSGGARLSRWGRRTLAAAPSIGGADPVEGAPAPEGDLTRVLYEEYANQIFRYCLHQLGSREEAEDAVQSTFLNAFRGIKRGIVPELESAWLFKIAHNVCLSRRRSSWRRGGGSPAAPISATSSPDSRRCSSAAVRLRRSRRPLRS